MSTDPNGELNRRLLECEMQITDLDSRLRLHARVMLILVLLCAGLAVVSVSGARKQGAPPPKPVATGAPFPHL